jgi:hypothetical protein
MFKHWKLAAIAGLIALASLPFIAQAASLDGKAFYGIELNYKGTNDLGTPLIHIPALVGTVINTGTGEYQADLLFTDTRTVTASSSEDLDLAGVLTDAFGTTLTMVEVVAVVIYADPTNTNNVVVGAATQAVPLGFAGTTPTFAVPPGGWFAVGAPEGGWAVGAGATDDLKIANSGAGTSVVYTVIIVGRSA